MEFFLQDRIETFVFVLCRVGGMAATAPLWGSRAIPIRIRGMLAVVLAAMAAPSQFGLSPPAADLIHLTLAMARETILGVAIGWGVQLLFSGVHLTGQIAGQMSGMQLADAYDPTFDASTPLFSQFFDAVSLAVFVAIGGPGELMSALLETFSWSPAGSAPGSENLGQTLVAITASSFSLGVRAGAPLLVSMLLAVLVLGLISRTMPQLNVMAIGFSLNAMAVMLTMQLTLAAVAWTFQNEVAATLDAIRESFVPGDPSS